MNELKLVLDNLENALPNVYDIYVDEVKPVPVDIKKISDVERRHIVRKITELTPMVNGIERKTYSTAGIDNKSKYNTDK